MKHLVLHVLPHPGGGGETYIDALSEMDGYRFECIYLAKNARASAAVLGRAAMVERQARRFDMVHVHGEVASALSLPSLARRPSVVTLHGLHLLRRHAGPRKAAAKVSLRLIVRAASRTICVSEAEYDEIRQIVSPRTLRRILVIHNGVKPATPVSADERAAARAELGIEDDVSVGAWIGSLEPHKDPLTPVRAVVDLSRSGASLALLVAGDGPLRAEVVRAARTSGSTAVHVLGFRTDIRWVLAAADFFVVSSHREGLSYSLLEAMSLGLVPVVSDAPGNPEAVGDAGIVVPCGDKAAFAAAFSRLSGDAHSGDLGERARERVVGSFGVEEMVRRTRQVYEDVISRSRRPAGDEGSPPG
jgi:glycosyltransferase involved in cell wall biosynthesis